MTFFWKTFATVVFTLFIKEAWQRQGGKNWQFGRFGPWFGLIWGKWGQLFGDIWPRHADRRRRQVQGLADSHSRTTVSDTQPLIFHLQMACWIPLYVLLQGHFCKCILCLLQVRCWPWWLVQVCIGFDQEKTLLRWDERVSRRLFAGEIDVKAKGYCK